MQPQQDAAEDVVIVGAGLAGVGVALGLHRKGVRSMVLESSPALRTSGFAFMTWTNAFRALDALGVGDKMRSHHLQVQGGPHEARCVQRNVLLQALEEELPAGTIRYSSRIVSIDDDKEKEGGGDAKILHLADGSTLRAKVLIGCDGINSVVAKWLGLAKPLDSGRRATRGHAKSNPSFPDGTEDADPSPAEMKQFVLAKLRSIKAPAEVLEAVERSEMNDVLVAPLRYRPPLSLLFGSISKGNVCVAGDALHPTTPDLAQGACIALEDAVVLARCLGDAMAGDGDGTETVEEALRRYAGIRRWRSAQVIAASYMVGRVQQSEHAVVRFARDRVLSGVLAKGLLMMPDYDCGTL
uniref:FAD-binding domain-containing protein n=1 Tax=Aegilops tauschii TaxID=37682 RepID=N1R2X0_AEGTA